MNSRPGASRAKQGTDMKHRMPLTRLTLLAASLMFAAGSASAALIQHDFSVSIDSGSLNGQSYSGQFSYDDAGLTGNDSEYLALSDFNFDFMGQNYTLADAAAPAEAAFWMGDLVGIDLIVNATSPTFGFVDGVFDIADAYFAYEFANSAVNGDAGFGSLTTQRVTVPEPGTLALMLTGVALFGWQSRRPR